MTLVSDIEQQIEMRRPSVTFDRICEELGAASAHIPRFPDGEPDWSRASLWLLADEIEARVPKMDHRPPKNGEWAGIVATEYLGFVALGFAGWQGLDAQHVVAVVSKNAGALLAEWRRGASPSEAADVLVKRGSL
ncbi:hypothetical protein GCM10022288_15850 [Gryllotalpicola kribbensis]|uniref:Uncharacterized protein n=1 Tax=Gryllotalpicola kribbensis TaxID=993084 RepID=A0ABP8ARL5_9MICO